MKIILVEDLGATVQRVIFDVRSLTPEFCTLPDDRIVDFIDKDGISY